MADATDKPGWFDWIFGNKVLSNAAKQGDNTPAQTPAPPAGIDVAAMAQQQADAAAAAKKKAQSTAKPVAPGDSTVHSYDWRRGNLNP